MNANGLILFSISAFLMLGITDVCAAPCSPVDNAGISNHCQADGTVNLEGIYIRNILRRAEGSLHLDTAANVDDYKVLAVTDNISQSANDTSQCEECDEWLKSYSYPTGGAMCNWSYRVNRNKTRIPSILMEAISSPNEIYCPRRVDCSGNNCNEKCQCHPVNIKLNVLHYKECNNNKELWMSTTIDLTVGYTCIGYH